MSQEINENNHVPTIVMEGYLNKRSINKSMGLFHLWQKRYFVVDDNKSLAYYSSDKGKLKGQIILTHDTRVSLSELRPFGFMIITPFVTMHLQASSDAERDGWIASIQGAIRKANSERKTKTWQKIKRKAQEVKLAKKTGRGTHTFQASGQQFECDTRYEYKRTIGRGAYGVVVAAHDTLTKQDVAIKKIKNVFDNVIDGKRILREVTILRFLKHKNISHIIDIMRPPVVVNAPNGQDEFNDVYIVLDLMDTDLHRVIYSVQALSDQHVQFLMFQLLSACNYLKTANIIHRDLKPSNILVNAQCSLRICDFGLARGMDDTVDDPITVYVVTRWYRAPELLLSCTNYTSAIDMWSVGCIFAELLGRKPLFPGSDYLQQLNLICDVLGSPSDDDLEFVKGSPAMRFIKEMPQKPRISWNQVPQLSNASESALDLLDKLLSFNPDKRITAEQALKHPYLQLYHSQPQEICLEPFELEDWESKQMTRKELRDAIMAEIEFYRPGQYTMENSLQSNLLLPQSSTVSSSTSAVVVQHQNSNGNNNNNEIQKKIEL